MNDKLQSALALLADKFGVTVEQLWKILVKQAEVSGWIDLGWAVVLLAASVTSGMVARYCWKRYPERPYADWETGAIACMVLSGILGLATLCALQSAVGGIVFPEGAALKSLLKAATS